MHASYLAIGGPADVRKGVGRCADDAEDEKEEGCCSSAGSVAVDGEAEDEGKTVSVVAFLPSESTPWSWLLLFHLLLLLGLLRLLFLIVLSLPFFVWLVPNPPVPGSLEAEAKSEESVLLLLLPPKDGFLNFTVVVPKLRELPLRRPPLPLLLLLLPLLPL